VVPAFLGQTLDRHSPVLAGLLVFFFFDTAIAGQLILRRVGDDTGLAAGCVLLFAGVVVLAVGVAAESLTATVASSIIGGLGQGLVFAAALAAINQRAPVERRGEAASVFFVGTYVGLSLPVIAGGLAIRETSLRPAAIVFCVCVACVALAVLATQLRAATRQASSF
jgi:MFS family permease